MNLMWRQSKKRLNHDLHYIWITTISHALMLIFLIDGFGCVSLLFFDGSLGSGTRWKGKLFSNVKAALIPWHLIREFWHTFGVTILALLTNKPALALLVMLITLLGRPGGTIEPFGKCNRWLSSNGVGIEWLSRKSCSSSGAIEKWDKSFIIWH